MAGNERFDNSSITDSRFVGSRGNFFGPSLERSGSFREGGESRSFGNGPSNNRVGGMMIGNIPSLSQSLMLEPIVMGDQKCSRPGDLKKVLGYSAGSSSEENTFGAAHSRPASHLPCEELKRYKDSVADSSTKARFRAKKLDEHLHKLNKYIEISNSKKQARNGLASNERSSLNLKMGVQVNQSLPEVVPQKLEDRTKNALTNKRVRTSMAETRAECRSKGVARQALVSAKDCDPLKDNSHCSDLVEEKVRRLPAVGEGWDKKIKRKRGSVGTSVTRPVDGDGELKGSMPCKVITEPGLPSGDAQSFRSGHANRMSGTNKLDGGSLPSNLASRATLKLDQGNANLTRDLHTGLNKVKPLAKGNNGLNVREENHVASASLLTKSKGSRASRSISATSPNSSLSISHVSDNGDPPLGENKNSPLGIANIRKRALPGGSSSSPMAQWVGQRPQKISRTRRANTVSPVLNHEEGNIIYEGSSPSDLSSKLNSGGTSGSLLLRGMANGHLQHKVKGEKVSSPAQFSGGEESGACESELKEKTVASDAADEKAVTSLQELGPSLFVTKNKKPLIKEENGDGVRRQVRSGRGSFPTATISPSKEKLDNTVTVTPLRTTRPGGEKSGSKAGRPSKKQSDRKGSSRRGINCSSPDFTGESEDDREELLAAAVSARKASDQACSSSFWKNLEPIFGPVRLQDTSYFSQEVNFAGELHGSLSQMLSSLNNDNLGHEETSQNNAIGSGETNRRMQNHIEQNGSATFVNFTDQFQEFDYFCGKIDSEKILNKVAPLCQRVLSALILDDEVEEFEENYMEGNVPVQNMNDLSCDFGPGEFDGMEFEYGSGFGTQPGNRIFACNGTSRPNRSSIFLNHSENGFLHADVGAFVSHVGNDLGQRQIIPRNGFNISSFDSQYEKMGLEDKLLLELQSIDIHLDTVPDLDDVRDEAVSQEIIQLKQRLQNQVGRKKTCLERACKALQQVKEAEEKTLESVAMDKLVESAHQKLLSTRGSIASKYGIPKVSKQTALSFSKITIARCKALEETGTSCFNEPALRDALLRVPSQAADSEVVRHGYRLTTMDQHSMHRASADVFDNYVCQSDEAFAKSGPISNRGRKKEVLLDDVGGSAALIPLPEAKGKRSGRDRDGNIPKVGRPSLSNSKGERKSKAKPKQKSAQLSTPGNGFFNKFSETKPQKVTIPNQNLSKVNEEEDEEALDFSALPLPDLDTLDALGGNHDFGGNQDLSSLLNFDDVGLLDHDTEGLEIPMDDLSELNMF